MAIGTHAQRFCGLCRQTTNRSKSSVIRGHGSDLSLEDLPTVLVWMSGEPDPPLVVHDTCFHYFRAYARAFFDGHAWEQLHHFCRRVRVTHPALHDLGVPGDEHTSRIADRSSNIVFQRTRAGPTPLGSLPWEILRTILDTLRSPDLINLGKTSQQFYLLCSEPQAWVPKNLMSVFRWSYLSMIDEVVKAASHCAAIPPQTLELFECSLPPIDFKLTVHWIHLRRTRYIGHIEVSPHDRHRGMTTYKGQSLTVVLVSGAEEYVLAYDVDAYGLRDLAFKSPQRVPSTRADASVFSGTVKVKAGHLLPLNRWTYDGLAGPLLHISVHELEQENRLVLAQHATDVTVEDSRKMILDRRLPAILMPVTVFRFPAMMECLEMRVRPDFSITGLRAISSSGIMRKIGRLDPDVTGDPHARQIMRLESGEHIVALLRERKNDRRTFQLHSSKAMVKDFGFGDPVISSAHHDVQQQRITGLCVVFGLDYQVLDLQAMTEGISNRELDR